MADTQNYGDDVNASYLMNPSQFALQGVEDEEFEKPREKEELMRMFEKLGYELSHEEFGLIHARAVAREKNPDGQCSIQAFRLVLNEFITAQEYGTLDQWLDQEL